MFLCADGLEAADVNLAAKNCAWVCAKHLCLNVALVLGLGLKLAALREDCALYLTVKFYFTSFNVAFDLSVLTDCYLTLIRCDFTVDLAVDDHVIGELNGTRDFDSACENICCVSHSCVKISTYSLLEQWNILPNLRFS